MCLLKFVGIYLGTVDHLVAHFLTMATSEGNDKLLPTLLVLVLLILQSSHSPKSLYRRAHLCQPPSNEASFGAVSHQSIKLIVMNWPTIQTKCVVVYVCWKQLADCEWSREMCSSGAEQWGPHQLLPSHTLILYCSMQIWFLDENKLTIREQGELQQVTQERRERGFKCFHSSASSGGFWWDPFQTQCKPPSDTTDGMCTPLQRPDPGFIKSGWHYIGETDWSSEG